MTDEWYNKKKLDEMREQTESLRIIAEHILVSEQLDEISKKQDKQIELLQSLVSILGGNMDDGR